MSESLLPLAHVAELTGLRQPQIEQALSRGDFPRPVRIGHARRWLRSEVTAWTAHKRAADDVVRAWFSGKALNELRRALHKQAKGVQQ